MKIVIFGGSGFLGSAIKTQLAKDKNNQITIISRHEKDNFEDENVDWLVSDVLRDANWHRVVQTADWVIDCIGILLPSWRKQITYQDGIIKPAARIIDYLLTLPAEKRPQFMYISAKAGPVFMEPYMHAKHEVEVLTEQLLSNQVTIIYPPVIYHPSRRYSVVVALLMNIGLMLPGTSNLANNYAPIKRSKVVNEIVNVLNGQESTLTQRS